MAGTVDGPQAEAPGEELVAAVAEAAARHDAGYRAGTESLGRYAADLLPRLRRHPPHLITRIVTERGAFEPSRVSDHFAGRGDPISGAGRS
jgi:hypothetical protein